MEAASLHDSSTRTQTHAKSSFVRQNAARCQRCFFSSFVSCSLLCCRACPDCCKGGVCLQVTPSLPLLNAPLSVILSFGGAVFTSGGLLASRTALLAQRATLSLTAVQCCLRVCQKDRSVATVVQCCLRLRSLPGERVCHLVPKTGTNPSAGSSCSAVGAWLQKRRPDGASRRPKDAALLSPSSSAEIPQGKKTLTNIFMTAIATCLAICFITFQNA